MSQPSCLPFFQSVPMLEDLPEDALRELAESAVRRNFGQGETLEPDSDQGGLFLLASGRAKLSKLLPDGREQIIYVFSPGEPFCLCSAMGKDCQPTHTAALEPCEVYVVPGSVLHAVAKRTPELLFNILHLLTGRLNEAMERIESLSTRDVGRRLALFLVRLRSGRESVICLPMTHKELAKIVGVTPEALSRTFRKLSDAGLVKVAGREILVTDEGGLEELAGAVSGSRGDCTPCGLEP